ncbi:39S ribosomal protein L10, mitochondrial [Neodiprion lecontei]|uniref:Large ribosomal subunit protein uL10m n=1 Tax=Neodiprion lecontei TaxID=441921 RepID=A0A6J0BQE2_NEOLC|nr:39S ribosomal protein L10, mitochondrial [Neodiprion lecontei]
MTSILNKAWLLPTRQVIVQPKRFRGKINIQKPREPHYKRATVEKFVEPIYFNARWGKPLSELCANVKNKPSPDEVNKAKEPHPMHRIIAREARNWFENSNMVAFCHMNPFPGEEKFNFAVALKKHNMHFKVYGKPTIALALKDTPFLAVNRLFQSHNLTIFSPGTDIQSLLKLLQKRPELVLMAGIMNGKLMSRNELVNYAAMGDITAVRSRLVQVLQNAGGANLNRQITHHQSTLVSRLKQISTPEETTSESPEENVE